MRGEQTLTDILGRVVVADQALGVRVVLKLGPRESLPPGMRDTVTVLVNAMPGTTKDQIIESAMDKWNAGMIETEHGSDRFQAVSGEIVMVVGQRWTNAQVIVPGPA
jgi:hypothetical protein